MNPLHATRILDLTRLLPGAVATMLLHDLGAEIIKVEDPHGGDYARLMPPLIDGMGAFFRGSNAGKKSIALDLKSTAGQAALHRLIETADVLIEGFRPGVTARLAADYETLKTINPRLVYCSLSGWGQSGPYAQVSGHDLTYIARNGVLGADLNPRTPGAQVADVGGAYVAVMGILAALLKRERRRRGRLHRRGALRGGAAPGNGSLDRVAVTARGRHLHQPARRMRLLPRLPHRRRPASHTRRDRTQILDQLLPRGRHARLDRAAAGPREPATAAHRRRGRPLQDQIS